MLKRKGKVYRGVTGEINFLKEENKELEERLKGAIKFLEEMEAYAPEGIKFAWREIVLGD